MSNSEEALRQAKNQAGADAYDASKLGKLEGLEAVRKKPGMYIGGTDERALHHCVSEVLDNSVDEHLANFCTRIEVAIHVDGSISIRDNGRGIPVDIHPQYKIPGVEMVLTTLHSGGKYGQGGYKFSGGTHGVGAKCVNAVSEWFEVEVSRGGHVHHMKFARGKTVQQLEVIGKATSTGTYITFKPDAEIFRETTVFQFDRIAQRLRELAFLNSGLEIVFTDERPTVPKKETYFYKDGVEEFVKQINTGKVALHPKPIRIVKETSSTLDDKAVEIHVEVVLQYNDSYNDLVLCYTNTIHNPDGGTHLSGFRGALTRAINQHSKANNLLKDKDPQITGEDEHAFNVDKARYHKVIIMTDADVDGSHIRTLLLTFLYRQMRGLVDRGYVYIAQPPLYKIKRKKREQYVDNDEQLNRILLELGSEDIILARSRDAHIFAPAAIDQFVELLSTLDKLGAGITRYGATLAEYLDQRSPGSHELPRYIARIREGNKESHRFLADDKARAAFSVEFGMNADLAEASTAREGQLQRRVTIHEIFESNEMTKLLKAIEHAGLETASFAPAAEPRYTMTENAGQKTENKTNLFSSLDIVAQIRANGRKGLSIQRYKGLGEMNPKQLYETTMDPEKRRLLKVSINDAAKADALFTLLMGDEVPPRRQFIEDNALNVQFLDV